MFSKYSVKRPYTVLVGVVLVVVLGIVSLSKMTTDLLPDMSFQYALIITTDMGASPEEVETAVTAPIEASMATTSNIKNVSSISYNSYSIVTCEYEQSANMDSVVIEIQQKLDQLDSSWDDKVGSPIIMKINPDMLPIMMAAVDVDGMSAGQLTDYVEKEVKPALESVDGVASVNATGELEEKVVVTLNQKKIDKVNKKIRKAILGKFDDAQGEIDDAKSKVTSGQNALKTAPDKISQGINQINDKKKELNKTEKDLKKKLKELNKQKKSLETVLKGINSFIASDQYKGLAQLEAMIEQYEQAGYDTSQLKAQLDEANKEIAKQFKALSAMGIKVNGYKDLKSAASQISKLLVEINSGIKTIEGALAQIPEGKAALNEALDSVNSNAAIAAMQTSGTAAQLATAAQSLEDAQKSLDEAKDSATESADLNSILTMDTISGLLVAQNFDMPSGYVKDGNDEYLVRVGESVESVEELEKLILMDMNLKGVEPIRLSDVADIELTDNSGETYAIINGNPGITLSMEKQTGYSTGAVTDRLLDKFKQLEKDNDKLSFSVLMNQGIYIDLVVDSVLQNMLVGGILAILVLLLFLKDIKPTIVIACSIPLSVIVAVVLMYFTGITLNTISMSGLVLGIGMLVDNSIVVIENIYRLRGEGYTIRKAAVEGAHQVAGAIIASTLTTVSVYAPIIFTEGITRQLFVDLALTTAFTLGASLLVALTFVPAMSSATLKRTREIKHGWFDAFKEVYGRILAVCLRFKPLVFIFAVVLLLVSGIASFSRGLDFMDMDMETNQMSVTIGPKENQKLTFEELTGYSDQVIKAISDIDGIATVGASAGGNSTMNLMGGGSDSVSMYILLDEDTKVTAKEVAEEIEERTKNINCKIDTNTSAMDTSAMLGSGISVRIKGSKLETLQKLARDVADTLEKTEGTKDVKDGLDKETPQWTITVDKAKAAKYGYTVAQVYQLVAKQMASSKSATTISTDIKNYQVFLQTEDQKDTSLDDIKKLTFKYKDDKGKEKDIPLSKICTMEKTSTLSTISRDSQTRYLQVSCDVDENHNISLVSNEINKAIDKMDIPEGYTVEMKGEDQNIKESMGQLMLMLILAVVFIYLIMVAQFQSLLSPFIIMFTIPLAFTGGFLGLFLTGQEVSIISMLGFIMLSGLIVNNGIVLIDYINQARRAGESKKDAIIEAGKTRIRPILMTALTTILAMSTSAVGMGKGSEMMKPMAITIIGGLIYGTVLTLIVIPCIYDAFNREKSMVEEEL